MVRPVAAPSAPIDRCNALRINCRCIQRTVAARRALRCRLSPPLASLPAHSALRRAHALWCTTATPWDAPGPLHSFLACAPPLPPLPPHALLPRQTLLPPAFCPRAQVRKKRNREAEEAKPWCFLCCRGELAGCWPGGSCLQLVAVAAAACCHCAHTSGASYLRSTLLFPCFRVQR